MEPEALVALIQQCQQQDRSAQAKLYTYFAPKMYNVCLMYTRDADEAKDFLQEGFIQAFSKMHQFAFKGAFEGWLKRIFINKILLSYRKKPMWDVVTEWINPPEEPQDELGYAFEWDELMEVIQALPDRYRLVFNLYVQESYSHQEIAEALGISVGTSKSNLSRARVILQRKLQALHEKKNMTPHNFTSKMKGISGIK